MFSIIMTWIGTVLGLGALMVMAVGAFVVDVDDALGDHDKKKTPEAPESAGPTVAPLR
jgi:hypothetical protein